MNEKNNDIQAKQINNIFYNEKLTTIEKYKAIIALKFEDNELYDMLVENVKKVYTEQIRENLIEGIFTNPKFTLEDKVEELRIAILVKHKQNEDFAKAFGIKKIVYGDEFNYIQTIDNKYITYLNITIEEVLDYVTQERKIEVISSFYGMIEACSDKFSYYQLNVPISFKENIKHINNKINEFKGQEKLVKALKSDIDKFKMYEKNIKYKKMAFLGMQASSVNELKELYTSVYYRGGNDIQSRVLNDDEFDYVLRELIFNYQFCKTSSGGSYCYDEANDEYVQVLQVKSFDKYQNYLYLQRLADLNFLEKEGQDVKTQLIINTTKLSKAKSMDITSAALGEMRGRHNYDKSIDGQFEQKEALNEIARTHNDLRNNQSEVITQNEFKVVVRTKNYKDLKNIQKKIKKSFKGSIDLVVTPFDNKMLLLKNAMTTSTKLTNIVEMTLTNLAICFPYNYVVMEEKDGMYLCVNRKSIVKCDFYNKTHEKPLSCGFIFGMSGSGKSTLMKYILSESRIKGNKVFSIDQDNEFSELTTALGGLNINFGDNDTAINPLKIIYYENHGYSLDSVIRNQKSLVIQIMESINGENYSGNTRILFESLLNEMYDEYKDEEFTFSDIIEKINTHSNSDNKELALYNKDYVTLKKILENTINSYPMLNQKTNVELNGDMINFNITDCKSDPILLDSLMIIIFNYINWSMANNQLVDTDIPEEVAKKLAIEKLLVINPKYTNEQLESMEYKELKDKFFKERKKITIMVDEAHRMMKNKRTVEFIDRSSRESRKYEAGIWFASQSFADIFRKGIAEVTALYELLPYKFMLKQEPSAVKKLAEDVSLTQAEQQAIINAKKGTGLVAIGNKKYPYQNFISREWLDLFSGGQ